MQNAANWDNTDFYKGAGKMKGKGKGMMPPMDKGGKGVPGPSGMRASAMMGGKGLPPMDKGMQGGGKDKGKDKGWGFDDGKGGMGKGPGGSYNPSAKGSFNPSSKGSFNPSAKGSFNPGKDKGGW